MTEHVSNSVSNLCSERGGERFGGWLDLSEGLIFFVFTVCFYVFLFFLGKFWHKEELCFYTNCSYRQYVEKGQRVDYDEVSA